MIVAEGTNDTQRGNNLQSAYATATTLGPTATNRVSVIVPPGSYNLGTTGLVMNTSCVDLIGLVPAQMTTKQVISDSHGIYTKTVADVHCPVTLYSSANDGTVQQTVHDVHIESVILQNTGSQAGYPNPDYGPTVDGTNTVLRHVAFITPGSSMLLSVNYAGTYIDCAGGVGSFGGSDGYYFSEALGTFIDCVAGDGGFGGDTQLTGNGAPANGTFIGCTAGDYSFASSANCGGVFIGCVGGYGSFGGYSTASGAFTDCTGSWNSFGSYGTASGTFKRCSGWGSFGSWGTASGAFIDCYDIGYGFGVWGTLATTAKLRHCRTPATSFGGFQMASDDFNYNVGGSNTFLMLPALPTSTNGLPSGSVYNSSGSLMIVP